MKFNSTVPCNWYLAFTNDEGNLGSAWFGLYSLDIDLDPYAGKTGYEDGWGHCIPGDTLLDLCEEGGWLRSGLPADVIMCVNGPPIMEGITILQGLVDRYQDSIIYLGMVGKLPETNPKWFEYQVAWGASGHKGLRKR